jgi:hypothetical protein
MAKFKWHTDPPRWKIPIPRPARPGSGRSRRQIEIRIARLFRSWIRREDVLHRVFGPPLSYFEQQNRARAIFGMTPLTRADIPPGEDWDIIPTRAERKKAFRKILGFDSPAPEPTSSCDKAVGDSPSPEGRGQG